MDPLVSEAQTRLLRQTGDPSACHLCFGCQDRFDRLVQIGKGVEPKHFPPCQLSADIQSHELTEDDKLSELEEAAIEFQLDPVEWAKIEFGWEARPYQEDMLRCSSRRKVSRCGRRVGKTACMAVDILHKVYTNKRYRVVIVCPDQEKIIRIWEELDEKIQHSLTLKDMLKIQRKSPSHYYEFSNKSTIKGITAGSASGKKGSKVRGLDGHYIVLDECDFLSSKDFDAVLPVLASYGDDSRLWASSTPIGKREHFWRWSTQPKEGYKSFHVRSSESPKWTPEIEAEARRNHSESSYKQEYEAEFPELEQGVFPKRYVDLAIEDYDPTMRFRPGDGRLYGIGVDWNGQKTGCHIVLQAYDATDRRFWVARRVTISREQFTQTKSVEAIIELNREWKPSFIYVDAGFGELATEQLHGMGLKDPGSGLTTKVKAIAMGGATPIVDPYLGKIDKPTKPFIMNLCTRMFEQQQVALPKSEYHGQGHEGLVDQIMAYEIKRFGADGRPVYSEDHEHTLTAWALGIFGFLMEHSDIGRPRPSTAVSVVRGGSSGAPTQPKPPETPGVTWNTLQAPAQAPSSGGDQGAPRVRMVSRGLDGVRSTGTARDVLLLSAARSTRAPIPTRSPLLRATHKPHRRRTF